MSVSAAEVVGRHALATVVFRLVGRSVCSLVCCLLVFSLFGQANAGSDGVSEPALKTLSTTPASAPPAAFAETLSGVSTPQTAGEQQEQQEQLASVDGADPVAPIKPQTIHREGLMVEFSARSTENRRRTQLYESELVELNFRILDADRGEPLKALYPGVWIDMGKAWNSQDADSMSCKERVGVYLQGNIGIRPMIDLNSYFVLVLNQDPTISVIDPLVGMSGITKLFAQVILHRPGADWTISQDQKHLYVSMPVANQVAVVDTERFKVIKNVDAGAAPMRVALQPDGKYLWVGNSDWGRKVTDVTAIDTETHEKVAQIAVGVGHHEIAFSDDSRLVFVTSRDAGSVSVIDTRKLEKVAELATGPLPISLSYSALSEMLYVADGKAGYVSVIDINSLREVQRITLQPGLGPLRFSEDGRWGLVVNTEADLVHIFDAASNQVVHHIEVQERPYQIAISRAFAYVRSLGSERVSMINLLQLAKGAKPPVVNFQAGMTAPDQVKDIGIADAMKQAPGEAAMLVTSPADNTVYYYMEGMNAPMGNFRNYGHRPRAVTVVDRTLKEKEPGLYSAQVQLPNAGSYEIAFLLDSPRVLHCFTMDALPHPALAKLKDELRVEFLNKERSVPVGEPTKFKFRLYRSRSGNPETGLEKALVRFYRAPGRDRTEIPARHLGDGVYEAEVTLPSPGAYYLYVGSPEEELGFGQLPYSTLIGLAPQPGLVSTQ